MMIGIPRERRDPGTPGLAQADGVPVSISRNGQHPPAGDRLTYARRERRRACRARPRRAARYLLLGDFRDRNPARHRPRRLPVELRGHHARACVETARSTSTCTSRAAILDVPSGLCTVHSTPLQPAVCVHYNAHSCGYRHRMTVEVDPDRPLLDRRRMAWLADRVVFDDNRRVTAVPDWEEMLEAFALDADAAKSGAATRAGSDHRGVAVDRVVKERI